MEPVVLHVVVVAGAGNVTLVHARGRFVVVDRVEHQFLQEFWDVLRVEQCRRRGRHPGIREVSFMSCAELGVQISYGDGGVGQATDQRRGRWVFEQASHPRPHCSVCANERGVGDLRCWASADAAGGWAPIEKSKA